MFYRPSIPGDKGLIHFPDPNLTTWEDDYKQPFPKNRFLGQC